MQSITIKTPGVNDKAIYEVTKRLNAKAEIVLTLVKEDGTLDKDSTVTLKVTSGLASDIPLRTRYTLSSQNVSTYKLFQAFVKKAKSTPAKPVAKAKAPAKAKTKPAVKAKPVAKAKAKAPVKSKKAKETVPADSFPASLRSVK